MRNETQRKKLLLRTLSLLGVSLQLFLLNDVSLLCI